jgi:ABC-type transporter lipoprotein component MlaA
MPSFFFKQVILNVDQESDKETCHTIFDDWEDWNAERYNFSDKISRKNMSCMEKERK